MLLRVQSCYPWVTWLPVHLLLILLIYRYVPYYLDSALYVNRKYHDLYDVLISYYKYNTFKNLNTNNLNGLVTQITNDLSHQNINNTISTSIYPKQITKTIINFS